VSNCFGGWGYVGESFFNDVRKLMGVAVDVVERSVLYKFVVLSKCWVVECSFGWLED
jgi:hypothetical protein